MRIKGIAACLLAVAVACSFSGCRKGQPYSSTENSNTVTSAGTKNYITLIYSAADAFNPYTVTTDINRQLCKLLYEPLVKLDNEFKPVYSLASSVKTEGKLCTVELSAKKFSDGSAVTAQDVVYSYKLALSSKGIYASKLYEAESASAEGTSRVIFKLKKADPYFENLLDFPVIKAESEKVKDSDSVVQPPVGSGRYKVTEDRQGLTVNEMYDGKKGTIKDIRLINAPDSESVAHYVEIGASDIFYNDISDGNIIRMSGRKYDINLNNLVYIGINRNYGALAQNALRQAISSGIDRKKICQNAFYNNALPATGFFNPVWEQVSAVQNLQIESKSQITVENLEQIGYNKVNGKGIRTDSSGKGLEFTLLVNSENRLRAAAAQLIASQLLNYGIKLMVKEKSYKDYTECLKKGDFQLFLAEVKLTDNMDISEMVNNGGSLAFGLPSGSAAKTETVDNTEASADTAEESVSSDNTDNTNQSQQVLSGFYCGKNSITDVASVLQTEMPFIPVCYRTGVLFYNDNIENLNSASASDIYFSIDSYIYNS